MIFSLFSRYRAQDVTGRSTFTHEELPLVERDKPGAPPIYGAVMGKVVMPDGTPAAGVEVWLDNYADPLVAVYMKNEESAKAASLPAPKCVKIATRTNSTGRYFIFGFPLDEYYLRKVYRVRARHGGFYSEGRVMANRFQRQTLANLTLCPVREVRGRVMDGEGNPVSAHVTVKGQRGAHGPCFHECDGTNKDGTFLFEHVPDAPSCLTVEHTGYEVYTSELSGGNVDVAVQLQSIGGLRLAGKVVDKNTGDPVGNAVLYFTEAEDIDGRGFYAKADAEGRFAATACAPGKYKVSIVRWATQPAFHYLAEPLDVLVETEPVTNLEIPVEKGAILRGRVTDGETGAPASAGTFVDLAYQPKAAFHTECKVAPDGSYELAGLPPGKYRLYVFNVTSGTRFQSEITLENCDVKENHNISLPRRPFIEGTVVDEEGKPLAGATVCAVAGELSDGEAVSDAGGRYRVFISSSVSQKAELRIQAFALGGYSPWAGPFRLDKPITGGVRLQIRRAGRLSVEVVDQNGQPLQNGTLTATPETAGLVKLIRGEQGYGSGSQTMAVDMKDAGRVDFGDVAPGKYKLQVHTCGRDVAPIAKAEVTVEAGTAVHARVPVDLSGSGGVAGTVMVNGKPVPGAELHFWWKGRVCENACEHLEAGRDGRYVLAQALPGTGHLQAFFMWEYADADYSTTRTVRLQSGKIVQLDFDLTTGNASAEGVVTADGIPQSGTLVSFRPVDKRDGVEASAYANDEGKYRIERMPEGLYSATVMFSRTSPTVQTRLESGKTVRIDFCLQPRKRWWNRGV